MAVDEIDAMPTKAFFVDMLTRDIPLEQAVLDLVDNSVDGAKRSPRVPNKFSGYKVRVKFNATGFRIWDNCGGFTSAAARDYAFRFGRSTKAPTTPNSIGQFGVGMKRALFKFGRFFTVRSTTLEERWSIAVDVDDWERKSDWHFSWRSKKSIAEDSPLARGTLVTVERLRPPVAARFKTELFEGAVRGLIKAKHRQFIAQGLSIALNGKHIAAVDLYLSINADLRPGFDSFDITDADTETVHIRITVGVGRSSPREAGWYVICNGRVVLEADQRQVTGWGLVEDKQVLLPSYHNQFARFRGIVSFDCSDSARVPWNTTKDDVDQDSAIWRKAFDRMIEMARPVIDFLNELDRDVEEYSREHSALYTFVERADQVSADTIIAKSAFLAPRREVVAKGPRQVKIQYLRPIDEIETLEDALNVSSAKAVGERSFDLALSRHKKS